jgi:D-arabinose 1-dehydrogenase-like Zn-dependent alcohol dehydrogenase
MGRCAGAFAEYAVMDAREAIAIPPGLSMEAAAAVPLAFLVVHDMLVLQGRLKPPEWLLVTGVSSGVGVASLQAAKALGARVIGTSGSPAKLRTAEATRSRCRDRDPCGRLRGSGRRRRPAAMAPTWSSTPSAAACSPNA